jgi:GTP-binding protein
LDAYFKQRRSLRGVIQIMDVRHPLTDFDIELIEFANERGVAVHVLLTKADKLSRSQQMLTLKQVQSALEGASVQLFSAPKKSGVEDAREALEEMWRLEQPVGDS